MNSSGVNKNIQKLQELNEQHKEAILNIIDDKINSDMEKVLLKMDSMTKEFNLKIDSNAKEMLSVSKELNTKIDSIKWFILSSVAIISLIIAAFKLFS